MEEYNICTLSSPELANLVLDEEQLAEIYEEDNLLNAYNSGYYRDNN